LTAAAEDANRAAKDAASAAEDRKSEADTASAALQKSVTDAKTQRAVLVTQLASLRSSTADLESKRLEALDRQRQQAQLAAVTAASDRAAAGPSVPAVQAQVNQPPAVADLPVPQPPAPAAPPVPQPPAAPEAPAAPVAPAPPPAAVLPAPTQPTAPSPGGSNQTAVSAALGKVGSPYFYEYGGTGPYGFDCSGFTQNAFAAAGKYLPRTASQQFAQAPVQVPLAQAQPGDLLVWGSAPDFSHVAIYLGNGQVVQALNPSSGIQVTQLSWMAGMQLYPYAARY
jgi:cell wall-associated NlpC family hydrolase